MRKIIQETVEREARYCDYCGKELTEQTEGDFMIGARCNDAACFEASLGDVCEDCAELLEKEFIKLMCKGSFSKRCDSEQEKAAARARLKDVLDMERIGRI